MSPPVEVRLLEALIPPPDFDLVCLVGATYSLSPAVFLAIVSAASFDWNSRGGSVGFDSLTKEEWRALILEKRQNCLMFVDHHGALEAGAGGLRPLEMVSLDQVIKKRGRDTDEGGSLHSKLIVALYRNSKNVLIGRVYVGSKNVGGGVDPPYFGGATRFSGISIAADDGGSQNGGSAGLVSGLSSVELSCRG